MSRRCHCNRNNSTALLYDFARIITVSPDEALRGDAWQTPRTPALALFLPAAITLAPDDAAPSTRHTKRCLLSLGRLHTFPSLAHQSRSSACYSTSRPS